MRTDVVFLSTPDSIHLYYGSTFLRGRQLTELLAARLSDCYSLTFTTDCQQTDSIIVLTKGFLASASPQSLADLKAGRNVLLADPVDLGMPVADLIALAAMVDGFVASSKRQLAALQKQFPDKPCHLVTHNVDQRLPVFEPPGERLRVAYVGLLQNCRYLSELGQLAEILETPSGGSADGWMARLPEFNCHYALRRPDDTFGLKSFIVGLFGRAHDSVAFRPSSKGLFSRPHDFVAFKPFTKGFTAAHCLSPILTERSESDAQFYLPDDYPFFLPAGSWNEVRDAMMRIRADFGGQLWRYAVDVMREVRDKSSADHIANEFRTMLAHYH
ncbi:MAG: hypothetical protein JWR80_5146 [Bradyrhizobium sp.]|nr:hypothetical protein [Bradyrhizobium sp.]